MSSNNKKKSNKKKNHAAPSSTNGVVEPITSALSQLALVQSAAKESVPKSHAFWDTQVRIVLLLLQ
jgi:hypothetical protein